eukprot:TRINITY_DN32675_c0_g2_i2.p1 TRINITY_DN32675_c0_g2~~TRINITY_DN32675_c0_g2_i2.p1  ORF type:complete len:971 (+),score=209.19 TRINITY_DN32675_c0_g2_i2:99-3011(+)
MTEDAGRRRADNVKVLSTPTQERPVTGTIEHLASLDLRRWKEECASELRASTRAASHLKLLSGKTSEGLYAAASKVAARWCGALGDVRQRTACDGSSSLDLPSLARSRPASYSQHRRSEAAGRPRGALTARTTGERGSGAATTLPSVTGTHSARGPLQSRKVNCPSYEDAPPKTAASMELAERGLLSTSVASWNWASSGYQQRQAHSAPLGFALPSPVHPSSSSRATSRSQTSPAHVAGGNLERSSASPSGGAKALQTVALEECSAEDWREVYETLSFLSPDMHIVCRGKMPSMMAVREQKALEFARKQRQQHLEAGQAHRRIGRSWREHQEEPHGSDSESEQLSIPNTMKDFAGGKRTSVRPPPRCSMFQQRRTSKMTRASVEPIDEDENNSTQGGAKVRSAIRGRLEERRLAQKQVARRKLNRRNAVSAMNNAERLELRQAFDLYSERGHLPHTQMLSCLLELGLYGSTFDERWATERVCREVVIHLRTERMTAGPQDCPLPEPQFQRPVVCYMRKRQDQNEEKVDQVPLLISFDDFCTELVPACRQLLLQCREDHHFSAFCKIVGKGPMSMTTQMLTDMAAKLNLSKGNFEAELAEFRQRDTRGEYEFEVVHPFINSVRERDERDLRVQQREMKARLELDDVTFANKRFEIVQLQKIFDLFDVDQSGELNYEEVMMLLKHCGMQPYEPSQTKVIRSLWEAGDADGSGEVNFAEFMKFMEQIRAQTQLQRRQRLRDAFAEKDSGTKDRKERCIEMKELLWTVMEQFDHRMEGYINFFAFEDLFQGMKEAIFAKQGEEIREQASALSMDMKSMGEYLQAYDQLDVDQSGGLNQEEVKVAMKAAMEREPSDKEISILWQDMALDPTAELSTLEFLKLMVHAQKRGIVPKEAPFRLTDVQRVRLQEVLLLFKLGETYVRSLEASELVDLVATYLNISAETNLRDGLPAPWCVNNVRELRMYALHLAHGEGT